MTRRVIMRVLFAAAAAVIALIGTLAGGAAYETTHPRYDRIVWIDRSGANTGDDRVVRRALFADGRFVTLTSHGYRAAVLNPEATAELFATASNAALDWHANYGTTAALGELVDLELAGPQPRAIRIANPASNLAVPPSLNRLTLLLEAADRRLATVAFRAAGLRFWAAPVASPNGQPVEALPDGFALALAARDGGLAIGGGGLAVIRQFWTDLDQRLAPGLAHRYVGVDGALWRLSWTLDLDTVGPATVATAP